MKKILGDGSYCNEYPGIRYSNSSCKLEFKKNGFVVEFISNVLLYFSHQNISGPLPKDADPYKHPWVSSHLKTFRKFLIEGVKDENFRNQDGDYFKRIGDQAIYLPVLHRSAGNWHFEPFVAYHYTIDMSPKTFQSDDAKFQKSEAEFLRERGFIK